MAYKLKPNKAVAKRFKVTAKGKLKRYHSLTSHLRSGRSPKKKRELRRPEMLFEGLARNMRRLMGLSKSPGRAGIRRTKVSKGGAQTGG
ncbi:MAG TPA: 50S ribosomal protein L35 [Tepidisphaeraceae bacterium]|nr:50S ribosomal protein L35 [Tepidisphaeraceae bacterium]